MSVSDFIAFARGSICSIFIDNVPLIEIARAMSKVEMASAVLLRRRKEWEKQLHTEVRGSVGQQSGIAQDDLGFLWLLPAT